MKEIIDDKYYTIKQIFENGFFFWYADYGGVYRTVIKDYMKDNKLGTVVVQHECRKTYKIKGENIKKFIQDMQNRSVVVDK